VKRIGLFGRMRWESSIECYRLVNEGRPPPAARTKAAARGELTRER
jgi:aspartate/glutamate racemase